jgi:hypothetical protein
MTAVFMLFSGGLAIMSALAFWDNADPAVVERLTSLAILNALWGIAYAIREMKR